MSACSFTIPFSGRVNDLLAKARNAIEGQGGTLNGDDSAGNFDVSVLGNLIRGSYAVTGQNLGIVIDSKPFFVPCSTVESFLKNKLKG